MDLRAGKLFMASKIGDRCLILVRDIFRTNIFNRGVVEIPKTPNTPALYPPDEDYEHICAIYLERVQPLWPILKVADIHSTHRPKCIKDVIFRQVCDPS